MIDTYTENQPAFQSSLLYFVTPERFQSSIAFLLIPLAFSYLVEKNPPNALDQPQNSGDFIDLSRINREAQNPAVNFKCLVLSLRMLGCGSTADNTQWKRHGHPDWLQEENKDQFLKKWSFPTPNVPRLIVQVHVQSWANWISLAVAT